MMQEWNSLWDIFEMNKICEMQVENLFRLSSGHVAFVGKIIPKIERFIMGCEAELHINGLKVGTIYIIGEDRFLGGNAKERQGKRSLKTKDDFPLDLDVIANEVKLILYDD